MANEQESAKSKIAYYLIKSSRLAITSKFVRHRIRESGREREFRNVARLLGELMTLIDPPVTSEVRPAFKQLSLHESSTSNYSIPEVERCLKLLETNQASDSAKQWEM